MDGSVTLALIAAAGTGAGGAGTIVAAVLSRRSAREAENRAQDAGRSAAAAEASQLGYKTLVFSVETLQNGYKRLEEELEHEKTDRRRVEAEMRTEINACHEDRARLLAQLGGNGHHL